jgi:hypothetical protein
MALALLPALLLGGDYFYWRLAVQQLRETFERSSVRARSSGWDVRHGAIASGGWPDAATLRVENLTVTNVGVAGSNEASIGAVHIHGLTWGSNALLLRAGLARPDTVEVIPVGLHPLKFADSAPITMSADHLRLRLHLSLKPMPRAVDIESLTFAATIPGMGPVSVGRLNGHITLRPDAGRDQAVVTFSAEAQTVLLPDGVRFGLGPEIADVTADGALNGPWPVCERDLSACATAWRDAGGSLDLHRLVIGWGQTRLDASATLALDEDLQPMGTGTGKIAGFAPALDALAANAVLTRSAAKAAKAVLSLLANTPTDGQPEEVEVPLTLQFRTLSVRQVPLVRLPALDWPEH